MLTFQWKRSAVCRHALCAMHARLLITHTLTVHTVYKNAIAAQRRIQQNCHPRAQSGKIFSIIRQMLSVLLDADREKYVFARAKSEGIKSYLHFASAAKVACASIKI
jgi:hypothetical protein